MVDRLVFTMTSSAVSPPVGCHHLHQRRKLTL